MTATRRVFFLATEFLRGSAVEQSEIRVPEAGQDVVGISQRFITPVHAVASFARCRGFLTDRESFVDPADQSAVEQGEVLMAGNIQCPQQAARPATTLIVVTDDMGCGADAQ